MGFVKVRKVDGKCVFYIIEVGEVDFEVNVEIVVKIEDWLELLVILEVEFDFGDICSVSCYL